MSPPVEAKALVEGTSIDVSLVALKELVSTWRTADLTALELKLALIDEHFIARDKALELQAEANRIHFESLNNEAARILKAIEITVSRDTWDAFQKAYSDRRDTTDRLLQAALPRSEFQAYKEATDKALTVRAAEAEALRKFTQLAFSLVTAGAALIGIYAFLK